MSLGFGLEQVVDTATRTELVRRMMGHLLPAGADTTAPTVSWLRPGEGATVSVVDPVEVEVEAVDERGDLKEVRLSVGGQLVQRKVSFPFQMRWQPKAADIGANTVLTVAVEDKAGNVTTSTRNITVVAGTGIEESPLATGVTTFTGTPVVGSTLTCVPSGFTGSGITLSYRWLRDGARDRRRHVAGRTFRSRPTSAPTSSCRVTATNSAGSADSTSAAKTVTMNGGPAGPQGPTGPTRPDRPAGTGRPDRTFGSPGPDRGDRPRRRDRRDRRDGRRPGPTGPTGPTGPQGPAGTVPTVTITCVTQGSRRHVHDHVQRPDAKKLTKATARLVGSKTTSKASGRGKVKVKLKGKVKRTSKVEVTYAQGKYKGKTVVPLGKAVKVKTEALGA